jgi:putative ABC transport system permease protein
VLRLAIKGMLARKGRLFLTSIAVVLGTAFLSGTFIFSDTLNRTFNQLFDDVFKNTDSYVRSSEVIEGEFSRESRQLISRDIVAEVKNVPGVLDAEGNIQAYARIVAKDGSPLGSEGSGPPTFGAVISSYRGSLWTIAEGRLPRTGSEIALDSASAEKAKYVIGDRVKVTAAAGSREFSLVGIASYGEVRSPGGATFALFDPETASEFLAQAGMIDSILVVSDRSVSDAELASRIRSALSTHPTLEVLTGEEITKETQDQIGKVLSFFSLFLGIFSFIALGVGCFVIYNVFSISAAQRQRENALLRAIGASRRQVVKTLVEEAFAVGVIGSTLGLLFGVLLSRGLALLLSALGTDIPQRGLLLTLRTVVVTLLVGVAVTMFSAVLPAVRAGKVPPLAALRDTALDTAGSPAKRLSISLILLGAGAALVVAVLTGSSTSLLGVAVLLIFSGTLTLGPLLARPVARFIGSPVSYFRGVTGQMARENTARNPKRTSRTAAPVLIGVALVTAVSALAASIKTEINDVFAKQFVADYAVSTDANGFGGLSPKLADSLNKLPDVEHALGLGVALAKVENKGSRITVIDPSHAEGLLDLGFVEGSLSSLDESSVLISSKYAISNSVKLGDTIGFSMQDGSVRSLKVNGVYENRELVGKFVVSRTLMDSVRGTWFDLGVYVKLKPGSNETRAESAIAGALKEYGNGTLLSKAAYIEKQSASVDQLLALVYGLLGLSIIIAIVGIVITLLLSVYERRREIGLLRAVGMTRSQVRVVVRWESVLTSLLGAVLGVLMGVGLGYIVILALRDQGLTTFSLPVSTTCVIFVVAAVVGVVAATYPARQATRVDILDALATN